jgi:predicted nucleic acid-binding Zn ribbon protein
LSQLSSISGVLSDVLSKSGFTAAIEEKNLQLHWERIVGKAVAEVAAVQSIENQVLRLKVKNATWRMELNFQKQGILEKTNTFLQQQGQATLRDVFLS